MLTASLISIWTDIFSKICSLTVFLQANYITIKPLRMCLIRVTQYSVSSSVISCGVLLVKISPSCSSLFYFVKVINHLFLNFHFFLNLLFFLKRCFSNFYKLIRQEIDVYKYTYCLKQVVISRYYV